MTSFLLALIGIFWLSGCDIYEDGYDISGAIDPCEMSGADCENPSKAQMLALSIRNSNPYSIPILENRVFDIGGFCNEAGFAENIIEYSVSQPSSGISIFETQKAFNLCKRGRYRIQVQIPDGFDVNIINRLTLELVGRNIIGEEFRNPLAARRNIDLISIPSSN